MNPNITPDRAAINRDNSRHSTGPKTHDGKHRSSLNALRHGLTGQVVVLPSEDLAVFERYIQSFHDDLKPVGVIELQLVQAIAEDTWRLNRAKAMEDNILSIGFDQNSDKIATHHREAHSALAMAMAATQQTKALNNLSLHQTRLSRLFHVNLEKLEQLQTVRRAQEREELRIAGRLCKLHAAAAQKAGRKSTDLAVSYDPAADGFVFTLAEIDTHLRREKLERMSYAAA